MRDITRKLLNDEELVLNREKWFDLLRDVFEGERTTPIMLAGEVGQHSGSLGCRDQSDILHNDPRKALEIGIDDLAEKIVKTADRRNNAFVPYVLEADWYGVHMVDKILGCDVYYNPEVQQWYAKYLKTEIGRLPKPDLSSSEPWRMAKDYARAFMSLDTKLPILATPVLSSPLNVAINLYGAEFLIAMIEEPDAAKHDLKIISETISELHRWYIGNVPLDRLQPTVGPWRTQPKGYGQICGCSTHLVSARMYEEFIMPLDDAILGIWPHGGMIHLCGEHRHLIPLFAQMPQLRSVQLNDLAADHLEYYVKGLRQDQVIYFSPTKNMTLDRSLEVSKGKKIVYVGYYDKLIDGQ